MHGLGSPTLAVQGLHPGELGPARSGISRALTNYTRRARCRTAGATFAASRLIYFPPTLDIEQSCVRKCWHLVCCTLWAFGSLVSGSSCVHVPIASRCLVDMKCLLALVELSSSPACLWGPESGQQGLRFLVELRGSHFPIVSALISAPSSLSGVRYAAYPHGILSTAGKRKQHCKKYKN